MMETRPKSTTPEFAPAKSNDASFPKAALRPSSRTFILGLGHQKCGTSWLYKYLSQSPLFAEGFNKEYHIWDAIDLPEMAFKQAPARPFPLNKLLAGTRKGRRHAMQTRPDAYFDYFASLLDETKPITADITPAYCGLKADRLAFIRDSFVQRGITVKPVILLRDPLARIKSAVRFNLDKGNYKEGIPEGETDFSRALLAYYAGEQCTLRTRYDHILRELEHVFAPEEVYVGIYETMFGPDEISRLSSFLGIETNHAFSRVVVQPFSHVASKETAEHTKKSDSDRLIRDHYAEVYDYCLERYPEARAFWST